MRTENIQNYDATQEKILSSVTYVVLLYIMSRCCYKISLNHSGMCVLSLACNELCTVALSTYIAIFPRLLSRPLHYYIRSSSVAAFTVWALTFNRRFRLVTAVRTYILSHWTHALYGSDRTAVTVLCLNLSCKSCHTHENST